MSQTKELLNISYHYDDDSGMYEIGELDTGLLLDEIRKYAKSYGKDKLLEYIKQLPGYIERMLD